MAHQTISDDELLDKALELFRTYGFEGVSLSRLSAATGLEKASLYYRFPGGKEEIAMAVANLCVSSFDKHIVTVLEADGPPRKRVAAAAELLRTFYRDGTRSCVTDVLSIPGGGEQLAATLKIAMQAWIEAYAKIARESGLSPALARSRAEEVVLRIEGSLVMARVLGDTSVFLRTIKMMPDLLTKAS